MVIAWLPDRPMAVDLLFFSCHYSLIVAWVVEVTVDKLWIKFWLLWINFDWLWFIFYWSLIDLVLFDRFMIVDQALIGLFIGYWIFGDCLGGFKLAFLFNVTFFPLFVMYNYNTWVYCSSFISFYLSLMKWRWVRYAICIVSSFGLDNLAQRIGLASRYYIKNVQSNQQLVPEDLSSELQVPRNDWFFFFVISFQILFYFLFFLVTTFFMLSFIFIFSYISCYLLLRTSYWVSGRSIFVIEMAIMDFLYRVQHKYLGGWYRFSLLEFRLTYVHKGSYGVRNVP